MPDFVKKKLEDLNGFAEAEENNIEAQYKEKIEALTMSQLGLQTLLTQVVGGNCIIDALILFGATIFAAQYQYGEVELLFFFFGLLAVKQAILWLHAHS